MQFPSPALCFVLCLGLLADFASTQTPTEPAASATFLKLPLGRRGEVAAQLLAQLPENPAIAALRALAHDADAAAQQRIKPRAARHGKRTIEFPEERSLPQRCDYLFGIGTIVPLGAAHAAPTVADPMIVQQALLGCVPDADRACAVILQRLDRDSGADRFADFMHSWRNGDESFYEALDRTAGTKDSVFFFDVMLDDFRGQFGGAGSDTPLRGGLQQAHDALHAAFLAYRQYRGFREAVAWSLVLPPDQPLPTRLARYEEKAAGAYSLREQVTMVAAAMDYDLDKLLATITATAAPLPHPLWQGAYDPYPAWNATFSGMLPKMIDRAGSSDALLQKAIAERRALANTIAELARKLVGDAEAAHAAH